MPDSLSHGNPPSADGVPMRWIPAGPSPASSPADVGPCEPIDRRELGAGSSHESSAKATYCAWTESISHHSETLVSDASPVNTRKQWFPLVSKW